MEKLNRDLNILQLSPFFSPNIGGVETHLDDLVKELANRRINSYVLTYQPVMSKINAPSVEKIGKYIFIRRLEIIRNLFLKIEPYPILDFLFLTPPLLIYSIYFLIKRNKKNKIDMIHAHGLNAAFISMFLKFFFKTPFVVSTHATYSFKKGLLSKLVSLIMSNANHIFTLSKASKEELLKIDLPESKISVYKYWVDQVKFNLKDKQALREKYQVNKNLFVVLFAGRLFEKKGVTPLIEGFNMLLNEDKMLIIAGTGPLESFVKEQVELNNKIKYLGGLNSDLLSDYYSLADALIIPSTHDEGFGRVIIEALSSGIPIIGSNRGGIPEAVNNEVSILIDVNPKNISKGIKEMEEFIIKNGAEKMQKKCRTFAEKNYSCDNINTFIKIYEEIVK
jgi:glycosyltransferase involved in cell wall biosynthesis